MTYSIYQLIDPNNGEVRYIGQTTNLPRRLGQHRSCQYSRGNPGLQKWLEDLRDHGDSPRMQVLSTHTTLAEANIAEIEAIRSAREQSVRLLNQAPGGNVMTDRFGQMTKEEWIDLGYIVQSVEESMNDIQHRLNHILAKTNTTHKEINKSRKYFRNAKQWIEQRLAQDYPTWTDATKVFFGSSSINQHYQKFSDKDTTKQ